MIRIDACFNTSIDPEEFGVVGTLEVDRIWMVAPDRVTPTGPGTSRPIDETSAYDAPGGFSATRRRGTIIAAIQARGIERDPHRRPSPQAPCQLEFSRACPTERTIPIPDLLGDGLRSSRVHPHVLWYFRTSVRRYVHRVCWVKTARLAGSENTVWFHGRGDGQRRRWAGRFNRNGRGILG